jgi:hypothetical protein
VYRNTSINHLFTKIEICSLLARDDSAAWEIGQGRQIARIPSAYPVRENGGFGR